MVTRLVLDAAVPSLGIDNEPLIPADAEAPWATVLQRLLSSWI
jgi:hypothetical protein